MVDPNTEQAQVVDPTVPVDGTQPPDLVPDTVPAETAPAEPDSTATTPPAEPVPPGIVPGEEPFVLPSGTTCVMSHGKGKHLLAAQRAAGTDAHLISYGLFASLCTFNGQKKVLEDVLEMSLGDVMKLTGKLADMAGGDFLP